MFGPASRKLPLDPARFPAKSTTLSPFPRTKIHFFQWRLGCGRHHPAIPFVSSSFHIFQIRVRVEGRNREDHAKIDTSRPTPPTARVISLDSPSRILCFRSGGRLDVPESSAFEGNFVSIQPNAVKQGFRLVFRAEGPIFCRDAAENRELSRESGE